MKVRQSVICSLSDKEIGDKVAVKICGKLEFVRFADDGTEIAAGLVFSSFDADGKPQDDVVLVPALINKLRSVKGSTRKRTASKPVTTDQLLKALKTAGGTASIKQLGVATGASENTIRRLLEAARQTSPMLVLREGRSNWRLASEASAAA